MKALVVACFYQKYNGSRPHQHFEYFKKNYDTKLITADFCHDIKNYIKYEQDDIIAIHVPEYKNNLSLKRIVSHIVFAVKVGKMIKKEQPDICLISLPPNLQAEVAARKAKRYGAKVIIDVVDIWPQRDKRRFPISLAYDVWSHFRTQAIAIADYTILECKYYQKVIQIKNTQMNVIYLSKGDLYGESKSTVSLDKIVVCYLGNMGNSYDFDNLIILVKLLGNKKDVLLRLIGDGEQRPVIEAKLNACKITYEMYGYVYDDKKKWDILTTSTFGYNAFKDEAEVALSYKAIDYLQASLPIINSSKADLAELIQEYGAGLNFESKTVEMLVQRISDLEGVEYQQMRCNARKLYEAEFSEIVFESKMDDVIDKLIK